MRIDKGDEARSSPARRHREVIGAYVSLRKRALVRGHGAVEFVWSALQLIERVAAQLTQRHKHVRLAARLISLGVGGNMVSSRAQFLLGSVGTLVLADCSDSASSFRPGVPPRGDGLLSPSSIDVTYVRRNPLPPIARFDSAVRAARPGWSSIYYYGAYLIRDGQDYATFPQSSVLYHDAAGVHIYNDVARAQTSFSSFATILLVADAGETIVEPNEALSPYLQAQIKAGHAQLVTKAVGGSSSTRKSRYVEMLPGDDYMGPGTGVPIPPNGNHIRSSHNECTAGGENIGITYTVPDGSTENVTVTQCVDNGTTNECFTFTDQVPGSTHTVSVWIPGYGPPNISMGVVTHSGTQNGIGWANLDGC